MATLLFSFYRKADCDNPDGFLRAAELIFCEYPQELVTHVVSPVHGIPSRLKWLPSLAELREACEQADAPRRRALEREARFAETRKMLAVPEPEPDDVRERVAARARAVADELRGKLNREAELALSQRQLSDLYGQELPQFSAALRAKLVEPRE